MRRRGPATSWLDQAQEEPSAALATAYSHPSPVRPLLRVWAWASILLAPVLLLALGSNQLRIIQMGGATVEASGSRGPETIAAQALALHTVQGWLDADPSPLPGGRILSSDGSTLLTTPTQDVPETLQRFDFTLAAPAGDFTTAVVVATSPALGAALVSGPSLTPLPPNGVQSYTGPPWPGHASAAASDPLRTSVATWASVYAGTDPVALRQVVGDPEPGHAYLPLAGANLAGAQVLAVAVSPLDASERGAPPATVMAKVALTLTWPGQSTTDQEGRPLDLTPILIDVLVTGADTASPRVVAWGDAGSGPSLEPYGNAITGRDLVLAPANPAPTPQATTPGGS